jgi:uncharacterized protein (TIGR03435 family)
MRKDVLLLTLGTLGLVYSQSSTTPVFDVTSIRPFAFGRAPAAVLRCVNDRFTSFGFPIERVIDFAYDLKAHDHLTLPAWTQERDGVYDIEAKAAAAVGEGQCLLMVRALLADRFKLAAHREQKTAQIYALVIAKGGPKMDQVKDSDVGDGIDITVNGNKSRTLAAVPPKGWTMEELARSMANPSMDHPIMDRTGLQGMYRIKLAYTWTLPGGKLLYGTDEAPDLFTAVQQQLGLKLEERKEITETLVVDHIERPSAN